MSTREQITEALTTHRPRGRHFCACGWEGDDIAVHQFDALMPLVERLRAEAAAEELEASADDWDLRGLTLTAGELRDRAAALRAEAAS